MPSSTASSGRRFARERLVDTLLLARRKHPGVSNRLDDLCSRYAIDNSRRTKHGALLDAELLAEVYIDLIGARQSQLILARRSSRYPRRRERRNAAAAAPVPLAPRVTEADRAAHRAFVATLGDKPIWNDFLARARLKLRLQAWLARALARCLGGGGSLPFHVLAVQADKIDGIEHQRREAAVAHRVAMISRANGNNSRGHSIMISGCRFSFGTFRIRNTPA